MVALSSAGKINHSKVTPSAGASFHAEDDAEGPKISRFSTNLRSWSCIKRPVSVYLFLPLSSSVSLYLFPFALVELHRLLRSHGMQLVLQHAFSCDGLEHNKTRGISMVSKVKLDISLEESTFRLSNENESNVDPFGTGVN